MLRQTGGPGRFDLRLLFALLLIVSTTAGAMAERRVALVIADDDYRLIRRLANKYLRNLLAKSGARRK